MARYTVLLNPPEDLRSDAVEPFTSHVTAGSAEHALDLALTEAADYFRVGSLVGAAELGEFFKTIVIFAGHHDNLA